MLDKVLKKDYNVLIRYKQEVNQMSKKGKKGLMKGAVENGMD